MDKIEKLLHAQLAYINYIMINVEYILKHNEEQHKKIPILLNRKYLHVIARFASDDTIINLYKLFKHNENHSFFVLKKEVSNKLISNEYKFVSESNENAYNAFLSQFKKAMKLYKEMKINDLRNTYVGHLDYDRTAIYFDIEKLNQLKLVLEKIHFDLIHAFFDGINCLDESRNNLVDVLNDNIKLKQYVS